MFVQGQVYRRKALHDDYGGQRQGGISTPAQHPLVFIFSGDSGQQYGYADTWEDGVYMYTGEGQRGDMQFIRGNRAVRDHAANGKDIHLFTDAGGVYVRYMGQIVCVGHHEQRGPDVDGNERQIIIFELVTFGDIVAGDHEAPHAAEPRPNVTLEELRRRALAASSEGQTPRDRRANTYHRSEAVKTYIQARADGLCEGCGAPAPFITAAGRPYIEPHHIRRLTDGGPDHPRWVVGVCPNCHRRAHYSSDRHEYNAHLSAVVGRLES
jgi:5-methylcytosine-specific restriction protein A